MRISPFTLFGTLLFVLAASPLRAQAVVDPQLVEFEPSADHNAVLSDGRPVVSGYDLELFPAGASQAIQVLPVGKPTPESDGKIRVSFLPSWPMAGATYEARVAAVGPTGVGESTLSNQFSYSGGCNYALSVTSFSIGAAGGSGSVDVLTDAACVWSGVGSAAWLTAPSASQTGSGTLTFSVAANTAAARTATLTIGGQTFTVTQAAAWTSCAPTISPTSLSVASGGQTGTIAITAAAGCNWDAVGIDWASFGAPSSGTGNGSVTYYIDPNPTTGVRSATLLVAGHNLVVTEADAGAPCSFALSPTSLSAPAAGASGAVAVTTSSDCTWPATSPVSWVTLDTISGIGSANVSYTIATNVTTSARTTTLTLADQSLVVTQPGRSCTFSASPTSLAPPAAGANGNIAVTTTEGCAWTARSPVSWLTLGTTSGAGSADVAYTVAANTTASSRSAILTIAGKSVKVVQPR